MPRFQPPDVRTLGLICMCSAVVFSLMGLWEMLQPSIAGIHELTILDPDHYRSQKLILGLLCIPGFFAGQLGYYLSGATAFNTFSRMILWVSAFGTLLYLIGSAWAAIYMDDNMTFQLGNMTTVIICPFIQGVIALIVKRAPVWKRIVPLFMLLIPAVVFPQFIANDWPQYGPLTIIGIGWLIFGYAVFSMQPKHKNARPEELKTERESVRA